MCFVPFKRFISYRIGAHDRTSVINGSGQRSFFCHKRYFVPRKRFKWSKSASQVCFVLFERFISYEIAAQPAGGGLLAVAYHGDGRR